MSKYIVIISAAFTVLICILTVYYAGTAKTEPEITLFTITSTNATRDVLPGDGFCLDATGECSLYALIEEANAKAGYYDFKLTNGTTQALSESATNLPTIKDGTKIIGINANYPSEPIATSLQDKLLAIDSSLLYTLAFISFAPLLLLRIFWGKLNTASQTSQILVLAFTGIVVGLFLAGLGLCATLTAYSSAQSFLPVLLLYLVLAVGYVYLSYHYQTSSTGSNNAKQLQHSSTRR